VAQGSDSLNSALRVFGAFPGCFLDFSRLWRLSAASAAIQCFFLYQVLWGVVSFSFKFPGSNLSAQSQCPWHLQSLWEPQGVADRTRLHVGRSDPSVTGPIDLAMGPLAVMNKMVLTGKRRCLTGCETASAIIVHVIGA
jgi:hypothetical protein